MRKENGNMHITLEAAFTSQLKINQSIAHNGVCLSVIDITEKTYTVTAIAETLGKTSLLLLNEGDIINLERCLQVGDRLDGHIVQGHVDCTARCTDIKETNGSWLFTFEHPTAIGFITVEKGSVCINGVSLTVVNSQPNSFSVAIIPYTFEHTNFKTLKKGDSVNIEFDIIGKYAAKLIQLQMAV